MSQNQSRVSTRSAPAAFHRIRICPTGQGSSPSASRERDVRRGRNENMGNVKTDLFMENGGPSEHILSAVITKSKGAHSSSGDNCRRTSRRSSRILCEGEGNHYCLCGVLRPLNSTWQVLGILPLSHNCQTCEFSHNFYSFPALANYFWVLVSLSLVIWVVHGADNILKHTRTYSDSNKTDFYAFSFSTVFAGVSGIIIYLVGCRGAKHLTKGLNVLHGSVEGLSLSAFVKMKRIVWLVPLGILVGLLLDLGSIFCGYSRDALKFDPGPMVGAMFMVNFLPNLVCSSYVTLLCIVAVGFHTVNKRVHQVLQQLSEFPLIASNVQLQIDAVRGAPKQMSDLRLTHESLCAATRHLHKAFGVQVLVIFCTTGFNFIVGVYGLIISTNGLLSSPELKNLVLAMSAASILSGLRILVTLTICQYVINKSNETSQVLNSYDHEHLTWNDEVTMEVDMFRKKIGMFPLKISCCDVFPLSTSVLAAVAGNSVTYVLVLLQFKLT